LSNFGEVRRRQRLENFGKALAQLDKACEKESYSDLERAGLAQMFDFTVELAWKTLKDSLFYEGFETRTPREAIRKSFDAGYLDENDTEAFLDGLEKRNLLSHTYEEKTAAEAVRLIKSSYAPILRRLFATLKRKQTE
jgi:nucleotidyltransferase substrate binding protein (TIGR01987 family)